MEETPDSAVLDSEIRRAVDTPVTPAAPNSALLDECRTWMVARIGVAMTRTLAQAADELLNLSRNDPPVEMRHLYRQAQEMLLDQGKRLPQDVQTRFIAHFNQEMSCVPSSALPLDDPEGIQLDLMEGDNLEQSMAANTLTYAIHTACKEEFVGLDGCVRALLLPSILPADRNPLRPEVIGAALMDAMRPLVSGIKVKLLLASQLNRYLPGKIRDIYLRLHQHLMDRAGAHAIATRNCWEPAAGSLIHTQIEEITIGDVRWQTRIETTEETIVELAEVGVDTQLDQLKLGDWIEFCRGDGSLLHAKLSWISPYRGIFVFTHRHGKRAISINADRLAARFREDRARVVEEAGGSTPAPSLPSETKRRSA